MSTVSVRYIVNDVDEAMAFYCGHLGFEEQMHPDPAFAMLTRGDLRLVMELLALKNVFVDLKIPGDIDNTITGVVDLCVDLKNVKFPANEI